MYIWCSQQTKVKLIATEKSRTMPLKAELVNDPNLELRITEAHALAWPLELESSQFFFSDFTTS